MISRHGVVLCMQSVFEEILVYVRLRWIVGILGISPIIYSYNRRRSRKLRQYVFIKTVS